MDQLSDSADKGRSDGDHEDRCGEFVNESERIHDSKPSKEWYVED